MKLEEVYFDSLERNITFYIGKSAKDNFQVIDKGEPDDLWFHAKKESSCHVIACIASLKDLEEDELKEIIKKGALLCKENTFKLASLHNITIMYTLLKNVKKTKTLGSVIVEKEKSIVI
jgi:predicted ribosome quality control (RQC) complex YloA/Tae2 family protein